MPGGEVHGDQYMDAMWRRAGLVLMGGLCLTTGMAQAQTAEEFYRKTKEVTLVLSAGIGGGYSAYGRLLSHHIGRYLPGSPTIIVQNLPGGGGLRATNFLYNTAAKDGSVIGLVHAAVPLVPLYGVETARFDSTKFNWIGSMNRSRSICISWHNSPIKNWQDMLDKEFVVGGTGAGAGAVNIPTMLNAIFNTKIKIIAGYSGGNDIFLAMERGEVHGRCGGLVTAIRSTRPEWFAEQKINIAVQIALERNPAFPDVPTVMEFVTNDRDRAILELVFAPQDMDRPVLAPPGVPPDRVALIRKAFMATFDDAEFQAEATKQRLDLEAVDGEKLALLMARLYRIPPEVLADAKKILRPEGVEGGADE